MQPYVTPSQVLIFPIPVLPPGEKELFYLFTVRQVADAVKQAVICFERSIAHYIDGFAQWNNRHVPVLSLETCLGLKMDNADIPLRTIVIRDVSQRKGLGDQDLYGICNVGAAVRRLRFPFDSTPVAIPKWIEHPEFVRGIYETPEQLLLVVDLERILECSLDVDLSLNQVTI